MAHIEVVRADPAYRRRAVLILLVVSLLMVLGIWRGLPALQAWVVDGFTSGDPGRKRLVCLAFGGMITLLAATVIGSGTRIARFARATIEAQRFPPPNLRVLRDTRVLAGEPAVRLGKVQRMLGVALGVLGGLLLLLGAYVVVVLWP